MAAKKKSTLKGKAKSAKKSAPKKVPPIPAGYHAITPSMHLVDAARAADFFQRAFGAKQHNRHDGPDGKVMHCEMMIGDSRIMFGESMDGAVKNFVGGLLVKDCDTVFQRALEAGATVVQPLQNQFYGWRTGRVKDPFGNEWAISTQVEIVSPAEMKRRMEGMMQGAQPAA